MTLSVLAIGGCADLRYYAHVTRGESSLLWQRRSLSKVVSDPSTPPELVVRLKLAQAARRFASERLDLPMNRSYTYYVDLHRPYVVWNVYATARFSVDAIPQCFPIAGCVAYRGWFDESRARRDAEDLRRAGNDVDVGGVPAYSTLGWFSDPILSSMLRWDDGELVSTIFHELAHQLIYVKGDTAFNESYATFVQEEGLHEWSLARGVVTKNDDQQAIEDGFTRLVLDLRENLRTLYASTASPAAMTTGKEQAIEDFRLRYARWRDRNWPGDHAYDAWVAAPINNARLVPFGLYDQWTPAFAALFKASSRSWPVFYAQVRQWGAQPAARREQTLRAWMTEQASGRSN